MNRMTSSSRRGTLVALSAAVAGIGLFTQHARATYADQNTFTGQVQFNDPTEWSTTALPTASELAVFPAGVNATLTFPKPTPNNPLFVYALTSSASGGTGGTIANGGTLGLLSTDTTSDGLTTAPALQATTGAGSQAIDIKAPIMLGNAASTSLQIATFDNSITNNAVTTEGSISEFAGSKWGISITGTKTVQFKGSVYATTGYAYSGDTTIADGANLRLFNNLIPHGPGRGNLIINGAGVLQLSLNSGYMIVNALNGSAASSITKPSGSPSIAFGANDASGEYDGFINNSGITLTKVGAGTEILSNTATNTTKPVLVTGGFLAVTSMSNAGTSSPLGTGVAASNAASLVLDGGALKYIGTGGSSDRLFTIGASGGGIDSSGTGAINLTNTTAAALTDNITRIGEDVSGAAVSQQIYMSQTSGLAPGMVVSGGGVPTGDTIQSINDGSHITLTVGRTANQVGSGAGADALTFTPATPLDRTFTLSGSNTGTNTLATILGNSPSGAKLAITKTGPGTWSLTGANTYTGVTTVNGGALVVNTAAATVILSGAGANIQSGSLAFDYTGGTSPATAIRALLAAGLASHFATGPITSSAAAADASHLTVLGYADAADVGLAIGSPASTSALVVKYTYVGDSSLDGKVDLGNDFNLFLQGYLNNGALTNSNRWALGDYNYDNVVNNTDFGLFVDGFKAQGGALGDLDAVLESSPLLTSAQKASLLSVVPEPTTLSLAAVAGLVTLGRRRRK